MTPAESIKWLRHAAYSLYHIESLEDSKEGGYLYDVVPINRSQLEDDTLRNIAEAIERALGCETLNWEEILPNLPHTDLIKREHLEITLDRLVQRGIGQSNMATKVVKIADVCDLGES
jgi:hypothetical protein